MGFRPSICLASAPLSAGQPITLSPAVEAALVKARYFSLIPCGESLANGRLCLLFSMDTEGSRVVWVVSEDDGRSFRGSPQVSLPSTFRTRDGVVRRRTGEAEEEATEDIVPSFSDMVNRRWTVVHFATHNLAMLRDGERYVWVGGQHGSNATSVWHKGTGIWTASGRSWRWAADRAEATDGAGWGRLSQWRDARRLLDGFHAGCREQRNHKGLEARGERRACEFDGRLSLAKLRDKYLLFARMNPTTHGSRFVQVARSADLVSWGGFEPIEIAGYELSRGDIYFLSAVSNPVADGGGSLVGLLPVVHQGSACVGISLSTDGQLWAPVVPITRCARDDFGGQPHNLHDGRRGVHHPVSGIAMRGGHVLLLVHENVPGIIEGVPGGWKPPRLVRYAVAEAEFRQWSACNVRLLGRIREHPAKSHLHHEPCTFPSAREPSVG